MAAIPCGITVPSIRNPMHRTIPWQQPMACSGIPCSLRRMCLSLNLAWMQLLIIRQRSRISCLDTTLMFLRWTVLTDRTVTLRSETQMDPVRHSTILPGLQHPVETTRSARMQRANSGMQSTAILLWNVGRSMKMDRLFMTVKSYAL